MTTCAQDEFDLDALDVPIPRVANLPPEVLQIIGHMHHHCRGQANASTARDIGAHLGIPERRVRLFISLNLEAFPFIICGTPHNGFWITDDPDDMAHYDAYLYSLIAASAAKLSAFRHLTARCGYRRTRSNGRSTYQHRPGACHKNISAALPRHCCQESSSQPSEPVAEKSLPVSQKTATS